MSSLPEGEERTRAANLRPLANLLPFLRPYRLMVLLALVMLVAAAAASLSLPLAVRWVIDSGFGGVSAEMDRIFLMSLGLALFLALASAGRFLCVNWLGERVAADLRVALYNHLLLMEPAFFERVQTGEILSRLSADTTIVRTIMGQGASVALRNVLLLAGALALMVLTSPSLSLMVLLLIPAIGVPLLALGRFSRRLARRAQDRFADTQASAEESLSAIRTVQSFTREGWQKQVFAEATERAFAGAQARIFVRSLLTALLLFFVFAAVAGIFWQGMGAVGSGGMSAGYLAQFAVYAVFAAGASASLGEVWGEMQLAAGAAERLHELLAEKPRIASPDEPNPLPSPSRGEIRFENVSFAYPMRPSLASLKNISFTIAPGEIVAIAGASGAGKSSLFHLLQRFDDPSDGKILFDGVDLREADLYALRRRMALVSQEGSLFNMSVGENIAYGSQNADSAKIREAAQASAAEFIEALPDGYDTMLGERGLALSTGQRQRVALARAWARGAVVLLLDEPTSALDGENEAKIRETLLRWGKTGKHVILIIAHRLSTLKIAKRVLLMENGELAAEGTHEKLAADNALYQRLLREQMAAPASNGNDKENG